MINTLTSIRWLSQSRLIVVQKLTNFFLTHLFTFLKKSSDFKKHNLQSKRTVVKSTLFSFTWFGVRIISSLHKLKKIELYQWSYSRFLIPFDDFLAIWDLKIAAMSRDWKNNLRFWFLLSRYVLVMATPSCT